MRRAAQIWAYGIGNPLTDEAWFNEQWFSMLGYESDEFPHIGKTWMS